MKFFRNFFLFGRGGGRGGRQKKNRFRISDLISWKSALRAFSNRGHSRNKTLSRVFCQSTMVDKDVSTPSTALQ